jgi:hypothetical protein
MVGKKEQCLDFPCLTQVAGALFGMKPFSGGLECDIGGVQDVVTPCYGILHLGLVEASMMVNLNKDLKHINPTTVNLSRMFRDLISVKFAVIRTKIRNVSEFRQNTVFR